MFALLELIAGFAWVFGLILEAITALFDFFRALPRHVRRLAGLAQSLSSGLRR